MLRRLSLGLFASAVSISSQPVIVQEDRDDYPKLYITGSAEANNPTTEQIQERQELLKNIQTLAHRQS